VALDHSNRSNTDLQKSFKRLQVNISELQIQFEELQQQRDGANELALAAERRASGMIAELEELRSALEQAERARRSAESEL
ncbi:unnamed protein product, partial [Rotaria socialis]